MTDVSHIVFDSGAFIKRATLEREKTSIYAPPHVLTEIRDRKTRAYLKCLPFQVNIMEPSKESLYYVTNVAKETGDFTVLSTTDLNAIALTYELHKKHIGETQRLEVIPIPSNLGHVSRQARELRRAAELATNTNHLDEETAEIDSKSVEVPESNTTVQSDLPGDDEWINEENFQTKAVNNFGLGGVFSDEQEFASARADGTCAPLVACFTADFAMQNVLLHAGLQIISLSGLRVTRPRTHMLWCAACFRPTKRKDTYFCPSCAQPSMHRIPVTLHVDGTLEFHFSSRYVKSLRGTKAPIRTPRGGKHADEPIYCPDQRLPNRRPAKVKHPNVMPMATNGMLDPEDEGEPALYLSNSLDAVLSNAFPLHDVTSQSARIGLRSDHQMDKRSWHRPQAEHGLRPTRNTAHLVKHRTGNCKKKALDI